MRIIERDLAKVSNPVSVPAILIDVLKAHDFGNYSIPDYYRTDVRSSPGHPL